MSFDFDVNDIETSGNDFTPLADGKYCAYVSGVEDEARQSQAGHDYEQVKLTLTVCKGDSKGRLIFKNCIYSHPNQAAGDIGQQALKSLFIAQGNPAPRMTVESLGDCNTCVEVVLKTKPSKNPQYGPSQEVYFNKCSDGACADEACQEGSGQPSDSSGDIW